MCGAAVSSVAPPPVSAAIKQTTVSIDAFVGCTPSLPVCPAAPGSVLGFVVTVAQPTVRLSYTAGPGHYCPAYMVVLVDGKVVGRTSEVDANEETSVSFSVPVDSEPHEISYRIGIGKGDPDLCAAIGTAAGRTSITYTPDDGTRTHISGRVVGWQCERENPRKPDFSKDCDNKGIEGARIEVSGPSSARTQSYGIGGKFAALVKKNGRYTVKVTDLPSNGGGVVRPKARSATVARGKDVGGIDFEVSTPEVVRVRGFNKGWTVTDGFGLDRDTAVIARGGTVRFCNDDTFFHRPYVQTSGPDTFVDVAGGTCRNIKIPGGGGRVVELFDGIHPNNSMTLYVTPD
jgi:hypothetical protein